MVLLGILIFIGLLTPALLAFGLFHERLLVYLTFAQALGLSLAFTFLFFSSTLLYVVAVGNHAINSEKGGMYSALGITVLSFGIDLLYSYFNGLSLGDFVAALMLLYIAFFGYFIVARVRELNS